MTFMRHDHYASTSADDLSIQIEHVDNYIGYLKGQEKDTLEQLDEIRKRLFYEANILKDMQDSLKKRKPQHQREVELGYELFEEQEGEYFSDHS